MAAVLLIGGGRQDARSRRRRPDPDGAAGVFDDGSIRVEGLGSAYRVAPRDGAVAVSVQP